MDPPDTDELRDFTLEFTYLDPAETTLVEDLVMGSEHLHKVNVDDGVNINIQWQIYNDIIEDYRKLSEMRSSEAMNIELSLPSTSEQPQEKVLVKLICSKIHPEFSIVHLHFPSKVVIYMREVKFLEEFNEKCTRREDCAVEDEKASMTIDTDSDSDKESNSKNADKKEDQTAKDTTTSKENDDKINETSPTKADKDKKNDEKTAKKRKPDTKDTKDDNSESSTTSTSKTKKKIKEKEKKSNDKEKSKRDYSDE
ncbi:hypothetical protein FOCC_FOCC002072, partial [Frankliniella occidentalis]